MILLIIAKDYYNLFIRSYENTFKIKIIEERIIKKLLNENSNKITFQNSFTPKKY